ncbi:MAG: hypothetical protein ACOC2K_01150 [Bacteroidota bacterium]
MSKGGGAGKVYFVLYLAVVLELLIIIVERDEAEESLLQKQRETMRIVESILSQLQSGSGTEGINTRPQDEITIPPEGINIEEVMGAEIKSFRTYTIEVGVTDVSAAIKQKEAESEKDYNQRLKKLLQLANVDEIEYQIFYNPSTDPAAAPFFPTEEYIRKQGIDFTEFEPGQKIAGPNEEEWEFMGLKKLIMDTEQTYNRIDPQNVSVKDLRPMYPNEQVMIIGPDLAPGDVPKDSIFHYSHEKTLVHAGPAGNDIRKRAFVAHFQPPSQEGWYKLRFASRTNRILGVRSDQDPEEMNEESTVNIGTVQLTVEALKKVQHQLQRQLDKFELPTPEELRQTGDIDAFETQLKRSKEMATEEEDAVQLISKINLYGYIAKLLTPGQSINFDQNRGSLEYNIRVTTPKPKIADPALSTPKYIASFDEVPAAFEFQISPYQGEAANTITGRVIDQNGATAARINLRPLDQVAGLDIPAPVQGGSRQYRGAVDQQLQPGKYTVEIVHQLMNKSKTETAELEIFETSLTEESESKLNNRLSAFTYYGYSTVNIDVTPTSGGKISADQFRIYQYTDENTQRPPIQGLSITKEDEIVFSAESNEITMSVTWVQPYTNEEVTLYGPKTFSIKQEEPNIVERNKNVDVDGTTSKIKVRVSGIGVTKPLSGSDQEVKINFNVGQPQKLDGLGTYDFSIEPSIEGDAESGYTIYLEMSGSMPRGDTRVRGTLTIPVTAVAVNPVSNKKSAETTASVVVPINFEPDRGSPARRRR